MLKKIIISILIIFLLFPGLITFAFIYSEQTQKIIINSFQLKNLLNQKVKNYISKKINDENLIVNASEIKFLEPNWPNLIRFRINDIKIKSLKQKEDSNIKFIELGLSYNNIVKMIFSNEDNFSLNYLDLKDLTLNGIVESDKFLPGPLVKILSGITNTEPSNKQNFKNILKNKILIGNINFFLTDKRSNFKERIHKINCKDVLLSKYKENSRTLNMKCNENNKILFSVTGKLGKKINRFYGDFENINHNLFFKIPTNLNLDHLKQKISSNLNGSYNFVTDKKFNIKTLDFTSKNSTLELLDDKNEPVLEIIFEGDCLWDKKENSMTFNNLSFKNLSKGSLNIDLISQTGFAEFKINKITLSYLRENLINYKDFYSQFINYNEIQYHINKLNGGSLNDINFQLKFSFEKKFEFINIKGKSKFKNIRFHFTNKYFKSILSTISGNLKFDIFPKSNKIINNLSWLEANIDASDGNVLLKAPFSEYKFDQAEIKVKINKEYFSISKAEFFRNNQKEYIIKDLKINKQNFSISKVEFIRNNLVDYTLENIEINNSIINRGYLKVRNNKKVSKYIKEKLNIDLIGKANLIFSIIGNIRKLDFNLKLSSNFTNAFLKVNFLNVLKKKNIQSSIKSEILFKKGKLDSINNIVLNIQGIDFKTKSILFENNSYNNIFLKNVDTPKLILNEIKILTFKNRTMIYASGKKIDLSYLRDNIKNKLVGINEINFDLTADEIVLDPKISISGNLKGTLKNLILECTAFGKMQLGNSSLLDAGKLKIFVNEQVAKLDGIGLSGGAETKINLVKRKNKFPQMTFDTSDGGKLLDALGFTSNVRSGEMKININFLNNFYNEYSGNIKSKKFSLINTPGIINSLSVLSFSGIQSIISGEGVSFDNGQAKIYVKDKVFNFDKVYLSSESLGIATRGKLNLENEEIDLRGSIAPIKLISRIISVVPAIGQLITGLKKEGLFAGQFKMSGSIENPKVKLNTLSFAPGILREIFSEDWLDQDNFFVKNKLN